MTTFRGIEVVAVASPDGGTCNGCIALEDLDQCPKISAAIKCTTNRSIAQPASLFDRPRVVLTGGRKPSFPIKAVWYRDGKKCTYLPMYIKVWGDILAVERADEGEEK